MWSVLTYKQNQSKSTETSTKTSCDGTYSETTEKTTVSTIDIVQNTDYKASFVFDSYDLLPNYKVIKNLKPTDFDKCFNGHYYVNSLTPCLYTPDYCDENKVGLLNNGFPCSSLEVNFEVPNSLYSYNTPVMMVERSYNILKNKEEQTRSVLFSAFGDTIEQSTFVVYTEGNYKTPLSEIGSLNLDGIICKNPASDLYSSQYVITIAAYEEDFLILCVASQFTNQFYVKEPLNQFIVLTREKYPSPQCMADINQELLLCGYNPKYLITMDHSFTIEENYSFDVECYKISSYCSTTVEETVMESEKTVIEESSSSSKKCCCCCN